MNSTNLTYMCLFRAERQSAENALQLEINFCNLLESPCQHLQAIYPTIRDAKKIRDAEL